MTEIKGEVEITPYLNPKYWDGHTLGVGEPAENLHASYSFRGSRYARRIINTRVRSNAVFPLHTFGQGETFNPAGYQPGTVVLFRQEVLYGAPVEEDYVLDELMEQEVPPRPSVTSPSFGDNVLNTVAGDGRRSYINSLRWGVVPQDPSAEYLHSTPASMVVEKGLGARACAPFINTHAPIVVGNTLHYPTRSGAGTPESLHRVNILHVIAYGTPEKQKKKVFSLVGRSALSGVH